jgi:hypothetical protein
MLLMYSIMLLYACEQFLSHGKHLHGQNRCSHCCCGAYCSGASSTGLCYFAVSILGYWAFGTDVGDNVLLAFKAGPHQWVVTMATMLVVVHVAAAFQVSTRLLVVAG